ncbi:MAG: hydrogenase maturation nickel metallochaperone HypA [Deferribacterales bacterium]
MHEASIAENILEIAIDTALKNGAKKIVSINLQIGKLSAIDNSALVTAFDVIKEGTIANEAVLNIENIPIIGKCNECGDESEYEELYFKCKRCGSFDMSLISGEELSIKDIEVE